MLQPRVLRQPLLQHPCSPQARQLCAPSRALLHAYGGPQPVGGGVGLLKDLSKASLPGEGWQCGSSDAAAVERAKTWRRLRYTLTRHPRIPLPRHLSLEQQAEVQELRLQTRLRKFWDLMHEKMRPWHRAVVLHLCRELPERARSAYLAMKPSTLQHLIAVRAQVEKQCRAHREDMRWHLQQYAGWLRKVERDGESISSLTVREAGDQTGRLRGAILSTLAAVRELQASARAAGDEDYCRYSAWMTGLLQELVGTCNNFRTRCLPYIQTASYLARQYQQDVEGGMPEHIATQRWRDACDQRLGGGRDRTAPLLPSLSPGMATWRYPPAEYVTLKRKGARDFVDEETLWEAKAAHALEFPDGATGWEDEDESAPAEAGVASPRTSMCLFD